MKRYIHAFIYYVKHQEYGSFSVSVLSVSIRTRCNPHVCSHRARFYILTADKNTLFLFIWKRRLPGNTKPVR